MAFSLVIPTCTTVEYHTKIVEKLYKYVEKSNMWCILYLA